MSTVKKLHRAALAGSQNRQPTRAVRTQLPAVAPPKLIPAFRPMTEPLPQRRAGRDVLQPCLGIERFLSHTPRPEPLDEDATTVCASRRFVGSLDANHDFAS